MFLGSVAGMDNANAKNHTPKPDESLTIAKPSSPIYREAAKDYAHHPQNKDKLVADSDLEESSSYTVNTISTNHSQNNISLNEAKRESSSSMLDTPLFEGGIDGDEGDNSVTANIGRTVETASGTPNISGDHNAKDKSSVAERTDKSLSNSEAPSEILLADNKTLLNNGVPEISVSDNTDADSITNEAVKNTNSFLPSTEKTFDGSDAKGIETSAKKSIGESYIICVFSIPITYTTLFYINCLLYNL